LYGQHQIPDRPVEAVEGFATTDILHLRNPFILDGFRKHADHRTGRYGYGAEKNKTAGIQTVLQVQDLQQLDTTSIQESKHIAITSGASTPTYLMEQIYSYLCQYPCQKDDIDLHKILD